MAGVGREGDEGGKGGGLGTEGEGSMGGKGGEGGVEEQEGYGVGQYTATALVSTVCHAPLAWNSGSMFFSISGVARRERAREAEKRFVREREADSLERAADTLEREREADRLARKKVATECRGLGVGQCTMTALVSTVCHASLVWNSGPIPTLTP